MLAWLIIPFVAFGIGVHVMKNAWAALLIYHALLLLPMLTHRKQWEIKTLFRGFQWKWLWLHLALCTAGFFLLTYLARTNGFGPTQLTGAAAFNGTGLGFALYFVLINPVFEETFWRALVAKPGKSITIPDIAFGSFHALILAPFLSAPYILGFVIALIGIAWAWRQIRFQTRGLAIPWIGHILGDAMFVAIIWYLM